MTDNKNSNKAFKESFKATSLFGGVQFYSIIIQIIRMKFVAMLLGPSGMGISNLLSSTTTTISTITCLGLPRSAVKNISEANGSNDQDKTYQVIGVYRLLVWATGLLGTLVCLILSPLLSEWTFGNRDYTVAFIILSITLLFQQLTSGQTTVMQGLHKYQFMAKSTVIGNTIGLLITIPLYYVWGIDAIVPVLVISSITSLTLSVYFYHRLGISYVTPSKTVFVTEGKNMVVMGVSLSLTSMVNTALAYYIKIFIEGHGGLADVGMFAAGFAIVNTYVSLVMTAMTTDYYPRLCAVHKDLNGFNEAINNQMQLSFIILAPLIVVFIALVHLIVIILYSDDFVPVEGMMYWAMFATYFQMFSWALSLSFIAKSDYKTLIITEFTSDLYVIPSQLVGYYLWGLTGVGVAYVFNYILYSLQVYITCKSRYNVCIQSNTFKIFVKQLPLIIGCLLLSLVDDKIMKYSIATIIVLLSFYLAYYELNSKIDVKGFIMNKIHKFKNHG